MEYEHDVRVATSFVVYVVKHVFDERVRSGEKIDIFFLRGDKDQSRVMKDMIPVRDIVRFLKTYMVEVVLNFEDKADPVFKEIVSGLETNEVCLREYARALVLSAEEMISRMDCPPMDVVDSYILGDTECLCIYFTGVADSIARGLPGKQHVVRCEMCSCTLGNFKSYLLENHSDELDLLLVGPEGEIVLKPFDAIPGASHVADG